MHVLREIMGNVPQVDYYPDGKIPVRNMTGYVVGSDGVVLVRRTVSLLA